MSCTVFALPYALALVIGRLIVDNIAAVNEPNKESKGTRYHVRHLGRTGKDIDIISTSDFLEKTFETPFTDKELLLKTIEEHGVQNITEEWNKITGNVDNYTLVFEKTDTERPYSLTIKYSTNSNVEEKIADLNSEYALNVQEDAYLSIIEKLKENNMELEEEDVLDDNTIVLTVNLEG